jgi:hypothetical protein
MRETIERSRGRWSGERVVVKVDESQLDEGLFRNGVSARKSSTASATKLRATVETEGGVSARGAFPTQGDDLGDSHRHGSTLVQDHAVLAGDTVTGKRADAAR